MDLKENETIPYAVQGYPGRMLLSDQGSPRITMLWISTARMDFKRQAILKNTVDFKSLFWISSNKQCDDPLKYEPLQIIYTQLRTTGILLIE